jgi:putative membrane protein
MDRRFWHAGPGAIVALAVLAGACRSKIETGTGNQGAGSSETAAITPADSGAGVAAGGELTDANIAALLDEANKADSAAGAIAVHKASNAEVKRFAREMMGEHHALRLAGEQVAKKAGLSPSAPANDPVAPLAQQETSVLESTPAGPAFDRAYIEQEVAAHRAVKDLLDKSKGAAQNADLKAVIEKATPIVERHLNEAEQLQGKLAGKA